jgi:hypothetical protein
MAFIPINSLNRWWLIIVLGFQVGCVAGGGSSNFQATKEVAPGGTIHIDCSVSEQGTANVHRAISPVSVTYRINDGAKVDISPKVEVKSEDGTSVYKVDIFTTKTEIKAGDVVITEFRFRWHGADEVRTGQTKVVE